MCRFDRVQHGSVESPQERYPLMWLALRNEQIACQGLPWSVRGTSWVWRRQTWIALAILLVFSGQMAGGQTLPAWPDSTPAAPIFWPSRIKEPAPDTAGGATTPDPIAFQSPAPTTSVTLAEVAAPRRAKQVFTPLAPTSVIEPSDLRQRHSDSSASALRPASSMASPTLGTGAEPRPSILAPATIMESSPDTAHNMVPSADWAMVGSPLVGVQHHDTVNPNPAYDRPYRSVMPDLKSARSGDMLCPDEAAMSWPDIGASPRSEDLLGPKGRWFGRYEAIAAWPYRSGGSQALASVANGVTRSEPLPAEATFGNRFVIGWESRKGPGFNFQYTDITLRTAPVIMSQFGPVTEVRVNLELVGLSGPLSINTLPGQTLVAVARDHWTRFRPTVFKPLKFPISTLSGGFGLDHTQVRQSLDFTRLTGDTVIETLVGRRRFSGIGPTFDIEYTRPIGHTSLAMIGGAQVSTLFGSDRWEATRSGLPVYEQHATRVVTHLSVNLGVEWSQAVGSYPDRRVFSRLGIEGQSWLGIGDLQSPTADFGFLSANWALGFTY